VRLRGMYVRACDPILIFPSFMLLGHTWHFRQSIVANTDNDHLLSMQKRLEPLFGCDNEGCTLGHMFSIGPEKI
jgi:hypothetical protein